MRIAGLGFRQAAEVASLREALAAAGGTGGVIALAVLEEKAKAPALQALAVELGVPVRAVAPAALIAMTTATWSDRVAALFGTGSVAEAVALATAGPGARLLAPRSVSADGMATAAIAITEGTEG